MKKNGSVFLAIFLIFSGSLAITIVLRGKTQEFKDVLEGKK